MILKPFTAFNDRHVGLLEAQGGITIILEMDENMLILYSVMRLHPVWFTSFKGTGDAVSEEGSSYHWCGIYTTEGVDGTTPSGVFVCGAKKIPLTGTLK